MDTSNHSTAEKPDLDWSQVRETIRMLTLAVAQIEMVMRDGNESVDTLTDSFVDMGEQVKVVDELAENTVDENLVSNRQAIIERCKLIEQRMESAIVAFQFYDRLSQRLGHVGKSLSRLSDLVSDQGRLYNPQEWQLLQKTIRSHYTISQDKEMFDALMSGASVSEALDVWHESDQKKTSDDSYVEFF